MLSESLGSTPAIHAHTHRLNAAKYEYLGFRTTYLGKEIVSLCVNIIVQSRCIGLCRVVFHSPEVQQKWLDSHCGMCGISVPALHENCMIF